MHNIRKIQDDLYNLGVNDRRITLFENAHPVPRGMNYNSYLLLDEKTVLIDAIDRAVQDQFLENLTAALAGRELDYLVVQHMEPDHCALIPEISRRYPQDEDRREQEDLPVHLPVLRNGPDRQNPRGQGRRCAGDRTPQADFCLRADGALARGDGYLRSDR